MYTIYCLPHCPYLMRLPSNHSCSPWSSRQSQSRSGHHLAASLGSPNNRTSAQIITIITLDYQIPGQTTRRDCWKRVSTVTVESCAFLRERRRHDSQSKPLARNGRYYRRWLRRKKRTRTRGLSGFMRVLFSSTRLRRTTRNLSFERGFDYKTLIFV